MRRLSRLTSDLPASASSSGPHKRRQRSVAERDLPEVASHGGLSGTGPVSQHSRITSAAPQTSITTSMATTPIRQDGSHHSSTLSQSQSVFEPKEQDAATRSMPLEDSLSCAPMAPLSLDDLLALSGPAVLGAFDLCFSCGEEAPLDLNETNQCTSCGIRSHRICQSKPPFSMSKPWVCSCCTGILDLALAMKKHVFMERTMVLST